MDLYGGDYRLHNHSYVAVQDTVGDASYLLEQGAHTRWSVELNGTPSGSDNGANLRFVAYSDGDIPHTRMEINRKTGVVLYLQGFQVTTSGPKMLYNSADGGLIVENDGATLGLPVTMSSLKLLTGDPTTGFTATLSGTFTANRAITLQDAAGTVALTSDLAAYAPVGAKYIVQTADATLTNEQSLGALTSGIVYNTVTSTTGVLSIATGAQMIAGFATQTANTVFSGPTTGADATPAFRALVAADIPNLAASKITTGQLALARGGTNADLSGTGGANQVLKQSSSGATITVAALIAADIPSLAASIITSGQLALARGGTNADLSATGAANSFLKQSSSGAAITVGTIASADINTALLTPGPIGTSTANSAKFLELTIPQTASETGLVTVQRTAGFMTFSVDNYHASQTPTVSARHARGTLASPTQVLTSDTLGTFDFRGYQSGGAFSLGVAAIAGIALEDFTSSAQGTGFFIQVTPATTTTPYNALTIRPDYMQYILKDAATNTVGLLYLTHNTSGTATTSFGQGIQFQAQTSTTAGTAIGQIDYLWTVATHVSRTGRGRAIAYDTAARTCIMWEASGSAAMVGFFGTNPIVKPTVTGSRGGNAAVASAMTALANLGLITDSTTA